MLDGKPKPPQERIKVDFDALLRPEPVLKVVTSKRLPPTCRLVMARAGKDATGAQTEDEEMRILRRAIMGQRREIVAGEVAARVTAEMVGDNSGSDTVERYRALSVPERLVLLAEKTGAQALLVLDEAGIWQTTVVAEVDETGHVTVREKRPGEEVTQCRGAAASFEVQQRYVGIRAKLISLNKEDASILADIEIMEPLSDELGESVFDKWSFTPQLRDYCPDYHWTGKHWQCKKAQAAVAWSRSPNWCHEVEEELLESSEQIERLHYIPRYTAIAERFASTLFGLTGACTK